MAGGLAEGEGQAAEAPAVAERDAESLPFAAGFAYLGSGALLVLEIVAGRLVAPTLGVSLYTWTSIIGVVIGGVSLGNYLGGVIADRWPTRAALAWIYLAASLSTLLVLALVSVIEDIELPAGAPPFLQVLWVTAVLFFLPSTILGAPTPLLTKLALSSVSRTGRVVGSIQAAASLGSVVGAFLAGFVLIPLFGTRIIVAGIALLLLLLAVLARPPWLKRKAMAAGLGAVLVIIVAGGAVSQALDNPCDRESAYYCLQMVEGETDSRPVRGLVLDHLLNGVVNVQDPARPEYDYERQYADVIETLHQPGQPLDSFLIGGGAYSMPRYLDQNYPGGHILVAEVDPEVTRFAQDDFFFLKPPTMEIEHQDARRVLRDLPDTRRFNLVLGDAFNDYAVPYHLTTREFHEQVRDHLEPNGLYLLNLVDAVHFDFLRSEIHTLRQTFPYVALMARPNTLPPGNEDRSTFVVVAGKHAPSQPLPTISDGALDRFLRKGKKVTLTDDHAPVDQLLAPVFAQALKDR